MNDNTAPASMTVSPVFDDARRITNYVAVTRDVTRELELEEQFRVNARDAHGMDAATLRS